MNHSSQYSLQCPLRAKIKSLESKYMNSKISTILLLFCLVSSFHVFSQEENEEDKKVLQFALVESKPVWPGCENEESEELRFSCFNMGLMTYIAKNVEYPEEARQKGIQGRVYVSFIIEKDGSISSVELKRGTHKLIDQAAIQVLKDLDTNMIPAMQKGKAVRMSYTIPINFKLRDSDDHKKKKLE